jgi:hypothetical protein
MRFVHIGGISGSDISLPGAVLRSSAIMLMGSGVGSVPVDQFIDIIGRLMRAAVPAGLRVATTAVPLTDVERAWSTACSGPRLVFQVG